MHELSIAQSIVETACAHAGERSIRSIRVRVGALTAVVPEAMRFCFDLVTEGTRAEGARLDIEHQAGSGHCAGCDRDVVLPDAILLCPCGSTEVALTAGRDLRILSIEVG
jgi:hydrogenase nickel incorporation protein HypA/HybF